MATTEETKNINQQTHSISQAQKIIMQTISDVVKETFKDSLSIVSIICSNKINTEERDEEKKIDKNIPSIAFASDIIDKYIATFTSSSVPAKLKKKVKVNHVFMKQFSIDDDKQNEKLLKIINNADIIIISCDAERISDYGLYYAYIDFLTKNDANIDLNNEAVANFFLAKKENVPTIELGLETLNKYYFFPQYSISIWNGETSAQLHANLNGIENIQSAKKLTLSEQIQQCVANTSEFVLWKSGKL